MSFSYAVIYIVGILFSGLFYDSPQHCEVHKIVRGEDGKVKYVEMEYSSIVQYTPNEMRPYMGARPLLTFEGKLIKEGKDWKVKIRATVYTPKANKYFGGIDPSQGMRFRLINGQSVYPEILQVFETSQKRRTPGKHIYVAEYSLSKGLIRTLEKWEMDELGFFWTRGFDNYDVRQMGVFQEQIQCISKLK